jgi:hypothetical protein
LAGSSIGADVGDPVGDGTAEALGDGVTLAEGAGFADADVDGVAEGSAVDCRVGRLAGEFSKVPTASGVPPQPTRGRHTRDASSSPARRRTRPTCMSLPPRP